MNDNKTAAIIIYLFTEDKKRLRLKNNELSGRLKRIQEKLRIVQKTQKGTEYENRTNDQTGN